MRLFDTHCHLDFDVFADTLDEHFLRANQHGVEGFLIPATGKANWLRVLDIARERSGVYSALGVHPYFLDKAEMGHLLALEQHLSNRASHCVAVGECGLDWMIDAKPDIQERFFVAQVELAKQFNLPLILHSRKSHNRLLQLLKQHAFTQGGILHGFSGSYQQAKQFVDMGFYIGVGGVITYERAKKTRQAVRDLPLDCLVLETDSPDMPLNGYQGKINSPHLLPLILSELSLIKNIPAQTIAENVWKNAFLALNICE